MRVSIVYTHSGKGRGATSSIKITRRRGCRVHSGAVTALLTVTRTTIPLALSKRRLGEHVDDQVSRYRTGMQLRKRQNNTGWVVCRGFDGAIASRHLQGHRWRRDSDGPVPCWPIAGLNPIQPALGGREVHLIRLITAEVQPTT